MLWLSLCLGAGAQEAPADTEQTEQTEQIAPPEDAPGRRRGMRLYLGGGTGQTSDGSTTGTAEMGFQTIRIDRQFGGAYGVALQTFEGPNGGPIPVLNLDAGLRWRMLPNSRVHPWLGGGLGLSVLLILPMPCATLATGVDVELGPVVLDTAIQLRTIADIYITQGSITTATWQVGVGF